MSHTTRKDYYVEADGEPIFGPKWKATADRKKWYKPAKKQKEAWLGKIRPGNKAAMKRAMAHPNEDGDVMLPTERKTDCWYYN